MTPTVQEKAKILMYRYNNDKNTCLDVVSEVLRRCYHASDILFYMNVKQEIENL